MDLLPQVLMPLLIIGGIVYLYVRRNREHAQNAPLSWLAFAVPLAEVRIVKYRPGKYASSIECEIPGHKRTRLNVGRAGRKDFAQVEEALARSGAFAKLDPPWPAAANS